MAASAMTGNGRIVVIGASAGGVEGLVYLATHLPRDFSLPMFVVLHVPPTSSFLPEILSRNGTRAAVHAQDGDPIVGGRITIAPPDSHLLLTRDRVEVNRGPKQNGHRPAIDPLFRSAAAAHGDRVVGVILSGSLDDGAVGLAAIKRAGGVTIVQEPSEALYPSMPQAAIGAASPDHVLPLRGIAEILASLDGEVPPDPAQSKGEESEMDVDPTQNPPEDVTAANRDLGDITAFTCPECSGTLWEIRDGDIVKLRCRVGHSYTHEGYAQQKAVTLEAALWTAVTALVEKADFSRRVARRLRDGGQEMSATRYEREAEIHLEQSDLVRQAAVQFTVDPAGEAEAS